MSRAKSFCFLLAFICFEFNSVQSKQCDWDDEKCLTHAASRLYEIVTTGKYGQLDPLFIESLDGDIGNVHYVVKNVTLIGLRDCKVQLLKYIVTDELTHEHRLLCPKIYFDFYFEAKGTFDGENIEGTGLGAETTEDYLIINRGKGEEYISEKDQKPRLLLKDYHVEAILRGNYTFEIKELYTGDQKKFDSIVAYLNKAVNSKENVIEFRILKRAMDLYMDTANAYLRDIPLEDAISYDV